jgi:hypothetical protein
MFVSLLSEHASYLPLHNHVLSECNTGNIAWISSYNTANRRFTSPALRPFAVRYVILAECLVTLNGAMYKADVTSNLPHFSFCPVRAAAAPSLQTPTQSDQRVSREVTAVVSHSLEHIISSSPLLERLPEHTIFMNVFFKVGSDKNIQLRYICNIRWFF